MHSRIPALTTLLALTLVPVLQAQKPVSPKLASGGGQKIDEEYTRTIKQNLQDPRITTELVDHLPASDTVPSPRKLLGRAVGAPGELTYAKDIYRYYEALALFKLGCIAEGSYYRHVTGQSDTELHADFEWIVPKLIGTAFAITVGERD